MVWIYLLGLLPSLGVFGWLSNNYSPSRNFTKVRVAFDPHLVLPAKMNQKYCSEQSRAVCFLKRVSWDGPCFVLFPDPPKDVFCKWSETSGFCITLCCSRSLVCPVLMAGICSKALLKDSYQVWHLLLLIDLSPPQHFKVREKRKKIFCFLVTVLSLRGFSVGLQIGAVQSRITLVPLLG